MGVSDPIGNIQARTLGITALEWMGEWQGTDRLPALWNDLSLRFEEQKVSRYL